MSILGAIGGLVGSLLGNSAKKKELAQQKHLAENSVSIRVADAKRAGVGTLAALGMNPIQMQPVGLGSDFADVGQNIGRAADAAVSNSTRAYNTKAQELDL